MSSIADLLSEKSVVELRVMSKTWEMKERSQMLSLAACVITMYSASVVDKTTIFCHLALHKTVPLWIKNAYPDIACQSLAMLPSASVYPVKSILLLP